jgi:catechol 2,3-dioxygenase-like lactoylglutathione lyase family enzyme
VAKSNKKSVSKCRKGIPNFATKEVMKQNILGIQQIGVGIPDVREAWAFYRKTFGFDVPIFQESAEAKLMTPYTGGVVHSRSAVLAVNLQGGAGLEIWQFTSRVPQAPSFQIQCGDLGVFVAKVKSKNVEASHRALQGTKGISELLRDPSGNLYFFIRDPWGGCFQVVQGKEWFRNEKAYHCGGVCGASLGVQDLEKSMKFYGELLGFDKVEYDKSGSFEDLNYLSGGNQKYRRVLLSKKQENTGSFTKLLGSGQIELFQALERKPKKIFENRFWGDQGFIHLCFDVCNMKELESSFSSKGYPFTVDSASKFDMGEAAGHFSYIEDPDGTLIEFVETYRIPILKKIGWYLDVSKRDRTKTLPDWMLSALRFGRVKD